MAGYYLVLLLYSQPFIAGEQKENGPPNQIRACRLIAEFKIVIKHAREG